MATWLGDLFDMKFEHVEYGSSRISMEIKQEHANALGITHGGVIFALADEAFARACNTDEIQAVACDINLHFYRPTKPGDRLTATATVANQGRTLGTYNMEVRDSQDRLVASGMGLSYRVEKKHG
jgi:acyl-CoA thioesterase